MCLLIRTEFHMFSATVKIFFKFRECMKKNEKEERNFELDIEL